MTAQDKTKPSGRAAFAGYDVTTVKLNKRGNGNMSWSTGDTSVRATNVTLRLLIASATGVREQLITGLPAWAESEHFDIQAKIVDPDPALKTRKQTREEAQAEFQAQIISVLQERIHLETHKETKIQPVFDLVLAKGGSKLKPHDRAGPGGYITWNNGVFTATDVELKNFVRSIEYESGRTVVNKTGLTGSYDLQLKWTREAQNVNATDDGSGDRPPDLFTALQDQLGLKLISDKGPVEDVVVDSIEQPTLTEPMQESRSKPLWDRARHRVVALALSSKLVHAAEYRGRVEFHGFAVPGAKVVATNGKQHFETTSDDSGVYAFQDLPPGRWHLSIEMLGFASAGVDISVPGESPTPTTNLVMLPQAELLALSKSQASITPAPTPVATSSDANSGKPAAKVAAPESARSSEESAQASDGLLVNGSTNNAATSQYSLDRAFGNQRSGSKSLYTGGLALTGGSSVFDARPYSLTGVPQPKASYETLTEVLTFGGPLNIPRLQNGRMWHGPHFFVVYQRTRNRNQNLLYGLVPTQAQRAGITDPLASALLGYYPLSNVASNSNYNYQTQVLNNSHVDALQVRLDKGIGQRDQLRGAVALQSLRNDNTNLFGFRDATSTLGLNVTTNWQHRLRSDLYLDLAYRFSRLRSTIQPFFANRVNVSGDAGLTGTLQDPRNWGPPTLVFSSGIASLSDVQSAFNRNRSDALNGSLRWYRGRHNVTSGGEFRREEFNYLQQQNPRGTFTFTGAAFGSDLEDFARAVPDVASINYGNADKYLRHSVMNAYIADDWRLRPELTLNIGVRWEYGAPFTELKERLANLDVASNFSQVATVTSSAHTGSLTGQHYPSSLIRPDKSKVQPRIGLAWRPFPADSLVIRSGYGIYSDTSVYEATSLQLAEQSPFARSIQVNNADCAQNLRTAPTPCSATTANTFAVDPNFRVGYAQTWNLSAQRDLPFALVATVSYLGVKGTRGVQDFLPNTYPLGAVNPCPACPVGFLYRSTNGNSTRNAGTVQLRRRLRSGLTASVDYTYSRSVDNDSVLGGQGPVSNATQSSAAASGSLRTPSIAQDWRNLRAERGLSTFDQRNLFSFTAQYSTGMGAGGGTLLSGWRGRVYKEWTVSAQASFGSGLPETPIFLAAVNGTGYTGSIRPNRTVGDPYRGDAKHFFNAAAFSAPSPGQWGSAGRNSLRGPGTYSFNASLARTFRIEKRYNLDIRADATNLLNNVVYSNYNNVINPSLVSPLFGVPTSSNPMRSMQFTARFRF